MARTIIGLGEVLWDVFPDERRLGGAPANVAYHACTLGNAGIVASRVGDDDLGNELTARLSEQEVETGYIQVDGSHPTGTVQVTFSDGDPRYEIVRDVAWDFIEWTTDWEKLATDCDAVCFSTLAQRNDESRETIEHFLEATQPGCLRVLDVNLRPPFVKEDVLRTAIEHATVVKYNHQEHLFLKRLFWKDDFEAWLLEEAGIDVVCVTRGAEGCEVFSRSEQVSVPAEAIDTTDGDPVGAGDAFSAALIDGLLQKLPLNRVAHRANRYAGLVASKKGGMPILPPLSDIGL